MKARIDITHLVQRDGPVTWLFCGDSITQGARHALAHRDYTQLFKERVGELARNEDVVINTAVGGWGTGPLVPRVEERILRFRPDVVFLMFGTNDAVGGPEGLDPFGDRYASIVKDVREASIPSIVLQTTVPMMPVNVDAVIDMTEWPDATMRENKRRGWQARCDHLASYVEMTRTVADRCGVPLVDHWQTWVGAGGCRGELLDGGFHPNGYGHRLIAHTLIRACGMWDDKSWICRLAVPVD